MQAVELSPENPNVVHEDNPERGNADAMQRAEGSSSGCERASIQATTVVFGQGMHSRRTRKLERATRLLMKHTGERGNRENNVPGATRIVVSMFARRLGRDTKEETAHQVFLIKGEESK